MDMLASAAKNVRARAAATLKTGATNGASLVRFTSVPFRSLCIAFIIRKHHLRIKGRRKAPFQWFSFLLYTQDNCAVWRRNPDRTVGTLGSPRLTVRPKAAAILRTQASTTASLVNIFHLFPGTLRSALSWRLQIYNVLFFFCSFKCCPFWCPSQYFVEELCVIKTEWLLSCAQENDAEWQKKTGKTVDMLGSRRKNAKAMVVAIRKTQGSTTASLVTFILFATKGIFTETS